MPCPRNLCPPRGCQRVSSMFLSRNFTVLVITFKSVIDFKLIFVYGVKYGLKLIFSVRISNYSCTIFENCCLFWTMLVSFFKNSIDNPHQYWASLVAQLVKNLPATWETWIWSLGWEYPLEKGKATHSSIVAWRIPMDYGVAKSRTWLSNFRLHFTYICGFIFKLS